MRSNYIRNYRKFAELLAYTLSRFDSPLNETKLLKLLYFADANSYEKLGSTISGNVTYYKNHFGPTPNYNILKNIYDELGDHLIRNEQRVEERKSCLIGLRGGVYNFELLSAQEMGIIDYTVAKYGKLSSPEIIRLSHFDPPYLASTKKKEIDFSHVRFRKTDEDYEANLDDKTRDAIAKDITMESRRKLKAYVYAGANS